MKTPKEREIIASIDERDRIKTQIARIEKEDRKKFLPSAEADQDENHDDKTEGIFALEEIVDALNDDERGDARLFSRLFKGKCCYDHAAGCWYFFNGNHWIKDQTNRVFIEIDSLVKEYDKEAASGGVRIHRRHRHQNAQVFKQDKR